MPEHRSSWTASPSALAGEATALLSRLGEARLTVVDQMPQSLQGGVHDLGSLRRFLQAYRDETLLPLELPWVLQAWQHAERFQPRELIALDACVGRHHWIQELAAASRHVGRSQLRLLKPLRDLRLVQRYQAALDTYVVIHGGSRLSGPSGGRVLAAGGAMLACTLASVAGIAVGAHRLRRLRGGHVAWTGGLGFRV